MNCDLLDDRNDIKISDFLTILNFHFSIFKEMYLQLMFGKKINSFYQLHLFKHQVLMQITDHDNEKKEKRL